jgi:hypothetical protein
MGRRRPAISATCPEWPATAGFDADDTIAVAAQPRDFALLDDIDSARIRAARVSPGDSIVAGSAAAALQQSAHYRVTRARRTVEQRYHACDFLPVEQFCVYAVQAHGVAAPGVSIEVSMAVREVQDATLAEEDVVVELLLEPLPELQRVLVDRRALVPEVVRADDRRVPAHVAAAQPPALEHRDIGDAVLRGEVVRGGQPVAAAADDHHVVATPRLGVAPEERGMLGQHHR